MKVANVTLPLAALLFLTGNGVALAGSASALDPYAYIQAPSRAEREQQLRKTKTFKVKHLKASKQKAVEETEPVAKAPQKPVQVIVNTDADPKFQDKTPAAKPQAVKTASTEHGSSFTEHGSSFLDGIKESTGGIAKSTKAVGSSMVNGSKTVGAKIAGGLKSTAAAGEKMAVVPKKIGEGFKSTGEKLKEGSSSVGSKIADGFKSAGGSLAAIPKAVGSVAGKVGGSTSEGAKKLAAAPAAGLGAIGHSISKMNPFHKDEAPTSIAQKPAAQPKSEDAKSTEEKTEVAKKDAATEPVVEPKNEGTEQQVATRAPETTENKAETPAATDSKTSVAQKDGGLMKRVASTPRAGIEAGMNVTRAGVGAISHSINSIGKLNPFHKKVEAPATATAAKPSTEVQKPGQETSPATQPPQLGERLTMPEDNAEQTAAGPGTVPQ